MATSQYSILRQYTPYTSPYNIDLIKDVMTYKQGQVDANRAKMSQQMDYLMGQQIDKAESREYLQNKMMNVINRVNDMYRGADLSSDGIVRHIQGEISSVLDSTVVNAIAGTKEGRRMQAYLNDLSLNHPEQYSAANAYVAMMPYYSWLNDGKAGSRLNPLNYTPYVDYNKELNDVMTQMQKTAGEGKKVTMPQFDKDGNPTGAMIEYNINAMTPQQVAAIARMSMSPKAKAQMSIDAAYMADTNPDMFSYDSYRAYMGQQVEGQQRYVDALEAELMGVGANDIKRQQLNEEIKRAKSGLVSMRTDMDIDPNSYSPYMGANAVVQNNFINGAAQRWSYDKSSYEMREDPVFWKREAAERQERQWAEDMKVKWHNAKIAEENAKSNRMKAQAMIDKNEIEKGKSVSGSGKESGKGTGSGDGTGTESVYVDVPIVTKSEKDISKDLDNKEIKIRTRVNSSMSRFITSIPSDDLNKIMSFISEKRKDPTSGYSGLSMDEAMAKYIISNGSFSNKLFSDDKLGKKRGDDFLAYLNESAKLREFDKRDKEHRDVSDSRIGDTWENMKKHLSPMVIGGKPDATGDATAAYFYISESLARNGRLSGVKGGIELPADVIGKMNNEINSISKVFRSKTGREFKDIDLWSYFKQSPSTGMWVIDKDKLSDAPDEVRSLNAAILQNSESLNFYTDTNGYSRALNTYTDFYDEYDDKFIDIDRKYYNILSHGSRVYSTKMTPKDAEYSTMNALRSIFNARADKKPEGVTDYQLLYGGTDESGNRQIFIKALYAESKGKEVEEYKVEVTPNELKAANINIEGSFNEISIGSYDSGIIPITFGDSNDVNYNQLLMSRGKTPVGSIYESTLRGIESIIEGKFSKDSDNIDVRKRRNALMSAANDIMKNYSKLAIEIKGFDKETSYMTGYNTILYKINESNPNKKPEIVIQYPKYGREYADDLNMDVNISPQSHFYTILESALVDEAQYMDTYGGTEINENGYLYKILKAVRGNE